MKTAQSTKKGREMTVLTHAHPLRSLCHAKTRNH